MSRCGVSLAVVTRSFSISSVSVDVAVDPYVAQKGKEVAGCELFSRNLTPSVWHICFGCDKTLIYCSYPHYATIHRITWWRFLRKEEKSLKL